MLGVPTDNPLKRKEFLARFLGYQIVDNDFEGRWTQAVDGAARRLLFSSGRIYLEAGEPMYFENGYGAEVGPSSLSRWPSLDSRGDLRGYYAEFGRAFGIEHEEVLQKGNSDGGGRPISEIEPLLEPHRCDTGAITCAEALIAKISLHATFGVPRSKMLVQRLPFLSMPAEQRTEKAERREMLRQIATMPDTKRRIFARFIADAADILRRLEARSPVPLTPEEDTFVGTLAHR